MPRIARRRLIAGIAALAATSRSARAETPLRLVFPFPAGGAADAMLRLIAEHLRPALGRPVVVENRAGAGGRIGARAVAAASPDGNTLLFGPAVLFTLQPHLFTNLGYDPQRDLAPVTQAFAFDNGLAVGPAVPARSLGELADWLSANPAQRSFGTPGVGTGPHFVGIEFGRRAGTPLDHAPYAGTPQALLDLAAGRLSCVIANVAELRTHHDTGRLRLLASAGAKRGALTPALPTFREQGFDITAPSWFAFHAPAATPAETVAAQAQAINAVLALPALRDRAAALGFEPTGTGPAALRDAAAAELSHWGAMVRAAGFKPEE